jgi:predicted nucleic acid-binding protein
MEYAFWDSSALVPLCAKQKATPAVEALRARYRMLVWWSAPVEMRGAFARLLRLGELTGREHVQALVRMDQLRSGWREVAPSEALRDQAERLVDRFTLRAADALQLAAALAWRLGKPNGRAFISGDVQLLEVAGELGFDAIEA